ncbi:MAG: glycosyltransferase family 2 protein [Bacillota bacterium]
MNCKVSILITTFQRPHLLKWGLYSLARQYIPFTFETLVINDGVNDETEEICHKYLRKLNLKYLFSGQRNLNGAIEWRVPGFAFNIGAKQSLGKVLILSCAEMFHLNDTVSKLAYPVLKNPNLLGIPVGKSDRDGIFLNHLNEHNGRFTPALFEQLPALDVRLPYLLSVSRSQYNAIGGYDEDFTGVAAEDSDLVDRLRLNGCGYFQTKAETVHLYHPRHLGGTEHHPAVQYNRNLYYTRQGRIVRNEKREWGKL